MKQPDQSEAKIYKNVDLKILENIIKFYQKDMDYLGYGFNYSSKAGLL